MPSALPLLLGLGALGAAFAFGAKPDPFKGRAHDIKSPALFDPNETRDQADAVMTAIARETDPGKLESFAAALTPDFPNSAALLRKRAAELRAAHPAAQPAAQPAVLQTPAGPVPMSPIPTPATPIPVIVPTTPAPMPSPVPVVVAPPTPFPLPTLPPIVPVVVPQAPLPQPPLNLPAPVLVQPPPPVIPSAPLALPGSGLQQATVTTQKDPLNVRSGPGTNNGIIGQLAKGSTVTLAGPAVPGAGAKSWFPIVPRGFAASDFLTLRPAPALPAPAPIPIPSLPTFIPANLPTLPLPAAPAAPALQQAIVTTQTDPLNVRSGPGTNNPVITQVAKGSTITLAGPAVSGPGAVSWFPIVPAGFVASNFVTPIQGVTAGFDIPNSVWQATGYYPMQYAAGHYQAPQYGYAAGYRSEAMAYTAGFDGDLPTYEKVGRRGELMTRGSDAVELKGSARDLVNALLTNSCRASDEGIVVRFQRAAKRAGIYKGRLHGSYDEPTRAALSKVAGPIAPAACFKTGGGPLNPDSYWHAPSTAL